MAATGDEPVSPGRGLPRGTAAGRGRPSRSRRYLTPKRAIPRPLVIMLGVLGFAVILAAWAVLSYGGLISSYFLPKPTTVAHSEYLLFKDQGFLSDVWASGFRIMAGFLLAALIAIPVGIAIGSFRVVQAFLEPPIAAIRYMPASAFIPLFIIWFGIANGEKIAVIFMGVFFPLTLMIADVSANVPGELLDMSYTLGAKRRHVFLQVLVPACWPGVVDSLRIGVGWAWTYLIVAELVAADTGIGHVILQANRFLQTDVIIAGIVTIGALGLITDGVFRWLYRVLFPYVERAES
ncbi:MAG: NitT/TauT family transport system permease protein [Gaiellales bacterium]|nr:NitT/TauT family transport system permease protein [Gaiellales bacterium]